MQLLTIEEAAERARISPRLLRQMIAEGRGPDVTRPGSPRGKAFVRLDVLHGWLRQRTASGSVPGLVCK